MDLTNTTLFNLEIALAVTGTGGPLDGAKVRLFINDRLPTAETELSQFDETTYTGHGDEVITWNAPSIADDGTVEVVGTAGEFRPTDSITPNTVFGALVLDGNTHVAMGGRFDSPPLPLENEFDALVVTVRYRPADGSIAVVVS